MGRQPVDNEDCCVCANEAHTKGLIQTLNKEADITIKKLAVRSGIEWMASQSLNTKDG